jgi:hypothetical protein
VNGQRSAVNGVVEGRPLCRLLLTIHAFVLGLSAPLSAQIQDNSFLIEEAYNQERGVVQHINTFARPTDGNAWSYSFTQEWPLGGIQHQLSYTLPVQNDPDGTGLGDVALNYRYQLLGNPEAPLVFAPRLSLLLPTGSHQQGRGTGGVGFQANLPLSLVMSPALVTHWNAGATITPSAKNLGGGVAATTASFNLGASAIWLLHPAVNLMLEAVWLSTEVPNVAGTEREEALLFNPGLRGALNLANLQIVPGVAYTFDVSSGSAEDALFVYLSFEHPFLSQ